MKKFAIIVAGGSGQRMGSSIPKQFLKLGSEVILMQTIRAFYNYDSSCTIILALPKSQIEYWKQLCKEYQFTINHQLVYGGQTRYHSVKNALTKVNSPGVVAIHDGVRPLVSPKTIDITYKTAIQLGNAIPYIDSIDSLRKLENNSSIPVDRSIYKQIQTPQVFHSDIILKAYEQEWDESFTDDATVVEKINQKINLVLGNKENIKITTQIDLLMAQLLINHSIE